MLVGCECSGVVREAFRNKGHQAYSCDLKPADDGSDYHLVRDIFDVVHWDWDLLIAHPPCTALAVSGNRYYHQSEARKEAFNFFMKLANLPIDKIAIENPVGVVSSMWRKPDQIVQPYEFGEDASKKTCLWLKGLPPLDRLPSRRVSGRLVAWNGGIVERWSNQTDSGQNNLPPSKDRAAIRSKTYQGIADAMAEKWG